MSTLAAAEDSSLCSSGWVTRGADAAAGTHSFLLPSLLGTAVGTRLHGGSAAGNMHTSDSSIASESFDCSASESDGGGSMLYMGGCKAAAACAAKDVVPVAERCRLECVARDEGDWVAAVVAVGGGWLICMLSHCASGGGWADDASSMGCCGSSSCMFGGPVAWQRCLRAA